MAVTQVNTAAAQAEQAIAAYIRGTRDTNSDTSTYTGTIDYDCTRAGDLNGIPVYEGRQTQRRKDPGILVKCAGANKLYQGFALQEVTVDVMLFTHWQENESSVELAEVVHKERAKAIFDLIATDELMREQLNKPEPPATDSRDVKNFFIEGALLGENQIDVVDGTIAESWQLQVFCYPFDALT